VRDLETAFLAKITASMTHEMAGGAGSFAGRAGGFFSSGCRRGCHDHLGHGTGPVKTAALREENSHPQGIIRRRFCYLFPCQYGNIWQDYVKN